MKNYTLSKKLLLLCAVASILLANSLNAQVFVSEDFNSISNPALPVGWTSSPGGQWITGEPNAIAPNAQNLLWHSLNDAAHTKVVGIDGSQPASDDAILSSPTISLPPTAGNAVLNFDIAYFYYVSNNTPPEIESLDLMVSTDGGFSWSSEAMIGPVNASNGVWETRSLSMGTYAGQNNLKIGFRYKNQGAALVGVVFDNIKLLNGTDGTVIAAFAGDHPDPSTGTGYQLSGSNATLTGRVKNIGALAINNYYIKYKIGNGAVQSSALISTPLAPMSTADFPAGLMVVIPADASYTIKAWVEATGDVDHSNDTSAAVTVGVPYIPLKRPVFEEGTGTWCGWCPRGAVFMDHFAATHPNGVAAQIAVHNSDPMTVSDYDSYMASYAQGYPNLIIDRTIVKDPRTIDTAFNEAQNNFGFADFTIGTPVINGNTVLIPVTIKPVVAINDPRLALVVSESNVTGSGNNWSQNNYYSGGASGIMGGWEDEEPHVENVYFHFVARSITPSPGGSIGSLPSTLVAGTTYTASLTATLNNGWKTNDLQYTALLINGNNTSIMNSAFTALPDLLPALGNTAVTEEVESTIEQVVLYPNPSSGKSFLSVRTKNAGKAVWTVLDITGKKVFDSSLEIQPGNNTIEIDTRDLTSGYYFVNFATGNENITAKLKVIK
jgi:hypothetical protein